MAVMYCPPREQASPTPMVFLLGFLLSKTVMIIHHNLPHTAATHEGAMYSYREGDVNIALIETITKPSSVPGSCTTEITFANLLYRIKAFEFTIDLVNQNRSLLPGIRLGFVVLNDCDREASTIKSVSLLASQKQSCEAKLQNNSFFDVAGLIGPSFSTGSKLASWILAPFQIPVISYQSTSDDLSDRRQFPNFLRIVPPDEYQTKAMLEFIKAEGWGLISMLYSNRDYGIAAYNRLVTETKPMGICIEAALPMQEVLTLEYCKSLLHILRTEFTSKVVVVFGHYDSAPCLLTAVSLLEADDNFVWIGSDSWAAYFSNTYHNIPFAPAVFVFTFGDSIELPGFKQYLCENAPYHVSLDKNQYMNTRHTAKTCHPQISSFLERTTTTSDLIYDTVFTYAYAIDNLIKHKCPTASGVHARACICIHRRRLVDYIMRVRFHGLTGLVEYDKTGARLRTYNIIKVNIDDKGNFSPQRVAIYNIKLGHLVTLKLDNLWSSFRGNAPPESSCTKPCLPGEIKVKYACCWTCAQCKLNEIISEDSTRCIPCGKLQNPDAYRAKCVPIPIKFSVGIRLMSVVIALTMVAMGIIVTIVILVIYLVNRNHYVIKSSSLELSLLQLISILLGYAAVLLLFHQPSEAKCSSAFTLLTSSFNILYAAACLKALRLYRIFQSHKNIKQMKFISSRTQILAMCLITLVEAGFSYVFDLIAPIGLTYRRTSLASEYAEVFCRFPNLRVSLFLTMTLTLLLLCSYFAFKTRMLPKSYSESNHVARCVNSTIVTWLVFTPALNEPHETETRTLMLCYIVIINQISAAAFFFMPRLYQLFTKGDAQLRHQFRRYVTDSSVPTGKTSNESGTYPEHTTESSF